MSEVQAEKKRGWSWLGFCFAPYYYAGYGDLKKGCIYAIIGAFPLFGIIIGIIAGKNARKDLPIGEEDFKWKNVAITVVLTVVSALIMQTLIQGGGNVNLVKNGTLNFDNSITIGEAFDRYSYFSSTNWKDFETSNGRQVVEVEGVFTDNYPALKQWQEQGVKKLTLVVQFKINKDDTFEIAALAMTATNEEGETKEMDIGSNLSQGQLMQFLKELYNDKPLT